MRKIRVHWSDGSDDATHFKDMIEEELGMLMENEDDILEVTLIHDVEFNFYDQKINLLYEILPAGIHTTCGFIPYTNIALIEYVAAEDVEKE